MRITRLLGVRVLTILLDLKLIVDKNIEVELSKAIKQYNLDTFQSVEVDGSPIIISKYNQEGDYFISPSASVKFQVDHLKLRASDISQIDNSSGSKYDDLLSQYVEDQYTQGEFLSLKDHIILKGHKTSPGNYWTGSWRSDYDLKTGKGVVHIDVHYYEDGNVRLQTIKHVDINTSDPVKSIKQEEDKLQLALNKQFLELNETTFKQLRRQLPVTRSKINWGKAIGNYKLGKLNTE